MIVRRKKLLAVWDHGYAGGRAGKVVIFGGASTDRDARKEAILSLVEAAGFAAGKVAFDQYCRNVAIRAGLGTDEVVDDIRARAAR